MDDDQNVNYVEEMTKKFRKEDGSLDIQGLARGKWEADKAIQIREQEASELREDLKKRETLEEVVAKIKAMKAEGSNQVTNPVIEPPSISAPNQNDVTEMVRQTLQLEKARAQRESNVVTVNQELTKMWGSGHPSRLQTKAVELGVNVQFLEDMKATHPQAFLKLVGDPPQRSPDAYTSPRGQSIHTSDGGIKNYRYWQKIRKDNPNFYHSVQGAKERNELAVQMGDSFYE